MRIFVTGASGSLGQELVPKLIEFGHEVYAPAHTDFDITEPLHIGRFAAGEFGKFDVMFNLAGFTNVDLAEEQREEAVGLNTIAPGWLAAACAERQTSFVHLSTDFVFDGSSQIPYTEISSKNPINFYGQTKSDGEDEVLAINPQAIIIRTSWLYGKFKNSFVKAIIDRISKNQTIRAVDDQTGTPTSAYELANVLAQITNSLPPPGVYHAAGNEIVNRYQQAQMIAEIYKKLILTRSLPEIQSVTSQKFATKAKRPSFSALDSSKMNALYSPMGTLKSALERAISELIKQ